MNLEEKYSFFALVLKNLGLPVTANRMEFLLNWAAVENTKAKNNPLATTWDMASVDPGQTTFNSAKVRNYSTPEIGARATAQTMRLSYYTNIMAALKADKAVQSISPNDPGLTRDFKTWGSVATYWPTMARIAAGATGEQIASFVKKNATQMAGSGLLTVFAILALAWMASKLS